MIEKLGVVALVGRFPIQIHHAVAGTCATPCETEIGFASPARAVHHATNDRQSHWRGDVLEPVLQHPYRINDIEPLTGAGWSRDAVHATVPKVQRFQNI